MASCAPTDNALVSFQPQNLFEVEEVNCICVDWKRGSQTTYTQAANNVRVVGAQVAQMISMLSVSGRRAAEGAGSAHGSLLGKDAVGIMYLKKN